MALPQTYPLPDQAFPETAQEATPITVKWITRVADIEALANEWTAFESTVQDRTVFSTFGFLNAWYGNYAGDYGGEPLIGIARRGGRMVGMAPLVIRRGCLGKIPLTRVQFAMHDAYSGEFLVEDNHPETITTMLESLADSVKFDVASFNGIEPGTSRFRALEEAATGRRMAIEQTNHPNAIVDLKNGYEGYCLEMSRNFRRTLKRQAQRVTEAGKPTEDGGPLTSGVGHLESCNDRLVECREPSYKQKRRSLDH